ncbi:hypothetical protein JG688_00001726 [Phytophthora aleatoria]|uniref:Zinc finger ZPR1-type domain-containing protein n=1 Tax=Phytophthora aleatoria TaxID=2496075 RepID=A0A8J5JCW3_9STRA|nr:hypothetical protein JG688_00001726 [Phytophthora aleatoria]
MADSPSKKKSMPSPIQKMERDAANNIWTIWYASQYGKLERVRSLLDRNAVSSIDVQELRCVLPCTTRSLQGETDHETSLALENLAIACELAGMLKLTETHLRTLLRLLMERYGGGYNAKLYHLNVRLASVLLAQKRVLDARELYAQCLPHAENLFGGADDHTVACTDALGKCCFLLGQFASSEHLKLFLTQLNCRNISSVLLVEPSIQPFDTQAEQSNMSEKAPQVLGGTRPNVDERFHLNDVDEENKAPAPSIYALQAEDDVPEVTTMESLCMNCHEDGTTKLLLTMIPYFREVILMSFECEHCGFKNSEVQFGGKVQEQGAKIELELTTQEDLNRQLIKADVGAIYFPSLDFEIPRETQRGSINTIEGVLQKAIEDLRENQEHRREIDPETTEKIDEFIAKLALMSAGITLPFTVVLDDPSGNSHIENPHAPAVDPKMKVTHYYRSEQQDLDCGLQPDMSHDAPSQAPRVLPHRNEGLDKFVEEANIAKKEVIQIPANCFACQAPGFSCMCMTDIPHFKEVIIMAFNCEACGFKTNEVKAGGAIPPQGERITLKVDPIKDPNVMDRDILKADSACVNIPEIELEMAHGSLGGLYTTVEGLLDKVRQNIEEGNPFAVGDSDGGRSLLKAWLARLDGLKCGTEPFTLVLEDPLANSFIYSPFGAAEDDPYMTAEKFTRTEYEDDVLGIADMKVENYSTDGGLSSITEEEEGKAAEPIRSDKETMGGGRAIDPSKYHPNPAAVMEVRQKLEQEKKQQL